MRSILIVLILVPCLLSVSANSIAQTELQAPDSKDAMIESLEPADILVVFAHPDDETFATGSFTKLSANGKRTQLVYATSGDAGGGSRYKPVADKYITYMVNVRGQIEQRVAAMEAHASQFDEQTIGQMRILGAVSGKEGFVEVRNLGESGTLSTMFTEGDEE